MEHTIIRKIMTTMSGIGKVEYRIHNHFVGLYRDNLLFAKIHAKELHFPNNGLSVKIDHLLDEEALSYYLQKAYNSVL